jgi:plastocyanin
MLRNCILSAIVVAGVACSGSNSSPNAPTSLVARAEIIFTPIVSITASGMSPLEVSVNVGQRVEFVNNDSRPHDLVGGKDPNTPDCPEITEAGFITPGQRAATGVFTRAQTCEYHDHTMMGVPAFQGRIIIR